VVPKVGGYRGVVTGYDHINCFVHIYRTNSIVEIPMVELAFAPSGEPDQYITTEEIEVYEVMGI